MEHDGNKAPEIFFFEQQGRRPVPKRRKKQPDELPHDLRFAHLNPRVAAYLANKEKEQQAEQRQQTPPPLDAFGKPSLLPQISQTVSLIRQGLDSILSTDEDTQRALYQQARTGAGDLLHQLARYLYLFQRRKPVLPGSLGYQLTCGWRELSAFAVLTTTREWQIPENKELYAQTMRSDGQNSVKTSADDSSPRPDWDDVESRRTRSRTRTRLDSELAGGRESVTTFAESESRAQQGASSRAKTRLEKFRTGLHLDPNQSATTGIRINMHHYCCIQYTSTCKNILRFK